MPIHDQTRRATDRNASRASVTMTDTVKQGILLRHRVGTVAAVEYLAARDIDTAIIRRVVHGQSLREGDRIALARQQQSHAALAV